MTIKKNIGKRIRIVRASQKMTQAQMSEKLNVSPATVSAWEIGDIGISVEAAIRISEFAGVSLDWLLNGKNETVDISIESNNTPEESKLLANFRKLTRTSQIALSRVSEVMQK